MYNLTYTVFHCTVIATKIWEVKIFNDKNFLIYMYISIEAIPCVVYCCMRDPIEELWRQARITVLLIHHVKAASLYIQYITTVFVMQLHLNTKFSYLMTVLLARPFYPTMHHFIRTILASYSTHIAPHKYYHTCTTALLDRLSKYACNELQQKRNKNFL